MLKIVLVSAALLSLTPAIMAADAPDTSTWVQFKSFTYNGRTSPVPGAGEYLNPIVAGFYPDPSICRVGDDYYLVNSAFNNFPSIPIWHSKDLVNWTQIGNVIDRPSQFAMGGGAVQSGTYAPTIRYHDGTYYVVCTLVGGCGFSRGGAQAQPNVLANKKLPENLASIDLKIEGAGPCTRVFYKIGSREFTQLGQDLQSSFISTDIAGGFQGVILGMFVHN